VLNFIADAAGDDHINNAKFREFEEALDQLIFCRPVAIERIGVATNVAATGINRALSNGPTTAIYCAHVVQSRC
jgi:hypothetical protein